MTALQGMDRYWKEVIQVNTWKHDIKVQYLYNNTKPIDIVYHKISCCKNLALFLLWQVFISNMSILIFYLLSSISPLHSHFQTFFLVSQFFLSSISLQYKGRASLCTPLLYILVLHISQILFNSASHTAKCLNLFYNHPVFFMPCYYFSQCGNSQP